MAYKLMSKKSGGQHDKEQWDNRTLEGEIDSFRGRTLESLFLKYLKPGECRVLEAGCGFGAWCEWLEGEGIDVIGIEYDESIVKKAKKAKGDIKVEHGDITRLEFDDGTFDAYISLGVIEHFENGPEKALLEAKRVLKSGGLVFVSTPLLTPLRRFFSHPVRSMYFFIWRRVLGKPSYFWEYRFTRSEQRSHLLDAGFEIVEECIDDYRPDIEDRHIGLWADWFFLRDKSAHKMWGLNAVGRGILALFKRLLPPHLYCSAYIYMAKLK